MASAEGTGERVVLTRSFKEVLYPGSFSWSPDGRLIAYGGGVAFDRTISLLDLPSGQTRTLPRLNDIAVAEVAWLPDTSGFLASYRHRSDVTRWQIGFISYPAGQFHAVSRDTNSYAPPSLSADGKTFATVQEKMSANLYLLPGAGGDAGTPSPMSILAMAYNLGYRPSQLSWANREELLLGGRDSLQRVSPDGSNPAILLSGSNTVILSPEVCGAGRYIVYQWAYHGDAQAVNLWRANSDGSNQVQLTFGKTDVNPACTPDGKWVYYIDDRAEVAMRVPLDGGQAEPAPGLQITNAAAWYGFSLSPDGNLLAGFVTVRDPATRNYLSDAILLSNYEGPKPTARSIMLRPEISVHGTLTPDGKSLAYPIYENGAANIWAQPLDGKPGHAITNFTSETIYEFHWSPDGKRLAVVRGHGESNVVLFHESSQ